MEGAWTPDQIRTFLEKTKDNPHHALFAFRLLAGVRPQEAVAVRMERHRRDRECSTLLGL